MALAFLNDCGFLPVAYSDTDDFAVDAAATGFFLPAAATNPAVVDQATYFYFAYNAARTEREHGYAVWDDATSTLLRATGTVLNSTNAGALVTFTTQPIVVMGGTLANDWPFSGAALEGADGGSISAACGNGTSGGGGEFFAAGGDGTTRGGDAGLYSGDGGSDVGGTVNLVAGASSADAGGAVNVTSGAGDTSGGAINITGGAGATVNGGDVNITPGGGGVDGGDFTLTLPSAGSGRQGLFVLANVPTSDPAVTDAVYRNNGVLLFSGTAGVAAVVGNDGSAGDSVTVTGGNGSSTTGGNVGIAGGNGNTDGGNVQIGGGNGANGNGGQLILEPGDGDIDGGDLTITLPAAGSGRQGLIIINNLPSSDPGVPGAPYQVAGAMMISL